jgi:hypothetical protein
MSVNLIYVRQRQIWRVLFCARRINLAIVFALAAVPMIGFGCSADKSTHINADAAIQESDPLSVPTESSLNTENTDGQLQAAALQFFQPEADSTAYSDDYSKGSDGSNSNIDGWQYCLASSHAEKKVYISPLFPKSATLSDIEASFGQMLSQSNIRHDDIQCPNGNDEAALSSMRQYAISFNQGTGNTVVNLNWNPSQPFQPENKDGANSAIHSSRDESNAAISGWQYCLAPSQAEHKIYISPLFPKSATVSDTEAAFGQILLRSDFPHDSVQCPDDSNESSISTMRQRAMRTNHESGNAIITLNWKQLQSLLPDAKTVPYGANYASNRDSRMAVSGWQYCLA